MFLWIVGFPSYVENKNDVKWHKCKKYLCWEEKYTLLQRKENIQIEGVMELPYWSDPKLQ